jgi:carboxypeptidase PM20D1
MNVAIIIIGLFSILLLTLIIRALSCVEKPENIGIIPKLPIDSSGMAERLSGAIQIETIGYDDVTKTDYSKFSEFISYLEKSYPRAHQVMKREIINGYSLLYHWKGESENKKPALFCAHIDVVPVEPGTESEWKYPPYSGSVSEGAVWGRGTQDIKVQIITLLEAAETMISEGLAPVRDIYFAFGHDEETRRTDGADKIADYLKEKGVSFEYVLDEGGCVIDNAVAGINRPIAFIGIAEKGFVNIRLSVKGEGGHSSMPPVHTAAGLIARAVSRIESNPLSLTMTVPVLEMFKSFAPAMSFGNRLFLSNLWLFAPLFKKIFSNTASGAAFLRTTTAPTMLEGSGAPNVLPMNASAVVNARILHGDSSTSLKTHLEKVISDSAVSVEMSQVYEPSKISPADSFGINRVKENIRALWPEAVIAPYLVVGGTDARKYEELTDSVYRFSPYRIDNSEMKQMHGTDEHISIANITDCVKFYAAMFMK